MCPREKKGSQRPVRSLIKDHSSAVYSSLLGIAETNKNLVVLENHCVIMRRDHKSLKGKVKIIGGGGAGIEPAEAYYVGKGMLTAAVVGRVFTAPSASEILTTIRELSEENTEGILLLVKNYIGDKLNFKLAMNEALSENIIVKMLVIGDDVYPHTLARHGRKGQAGSVLVYKIAGELAEQGKILEEIIKEVQKSVLNNLATTSVFLAPCSHSCCDHLNSLMKSPEIILGMGIYGKGGAKRIELTDLEDVVCFTLQEVLSFLKSDSELYDGDGNITVLVNNLGALTKLEEAVITNEVCEKLKNLNFNIAKLLVGTFMSSFSSQGFSVSILKINAQEILRCLNAPTSAPGWPKNTVDLQVDYTLPTTVPTFCPHDDINNAKFESVSACPLLSEKATAAMNQIVIFAAEALISCEKQLNIIDTEAGDADAGSVLRRAADAIKENAMNGQLDLKNPAKFLLQLSSICCTHMGGLMGALYSVFFRSASETFQNCEEITSELCCAAFREAVGALKCYGRVELRDRTIFDVLYPALNSFENAIKHGKSLPEAVYLAATTCEFKSEETKYIKPLTLLHSVTGNQPAMYADAGAHGATIWLRAVTFDSEIPTCGPGIFLWKFLNETESIYLLQDNLHPSAFMTFFERKLRNDENLVANLLVETVKFCREKFPKDPKRLSALVGSVYYTHQYFIASRWRTAEEVYFYFRESILRQSLESPPANAEIFQPDEAKSALIFFYETYIRNLPLTAILHLPHYKLCLKLKNDQ